MAIITNYLSGKVPIRLPLPKESVFFEVTSLKMKSLVISLRSQMGKYHRLVCQSPGAATGFKRTPHAFDGSTRLPAGLRATAADRKRTIALTDVDTHSGIQLFDYE
ncbi:hypothetical protein DPMN_069486 [Dreissena polymorpha]|uniref:Uncharacterized protein n=1 Tax=Dreissena polymorpha TaxID=45954 RepID=A0A9D3Z3M1_DREPO|nr:hypothetical protein DPMN_069486 [Dreissena polymorpha]